MAYDSSRGRVVLFGGRTGSTTFGDTWEWDGNAWIPIAVPASPPARSRHCLAYDSARARVVLVGKPQQVGGLHETWEYNGLTATWALVHSNSPGSNSPERDALAYDSARQRTVLLQYGGIGNNLIWEWDGATWIQRFPAAGVPSFNTPEMVYDDAAGRLVVLGSTITGPGWSIWEWDGGPATGWQMRSPASMPPARSDFAFTYDSTRNLAVLFGGWSALADTWEYDSLARAAVVTPYGVACGTPPLQIAASGSSRPLLGTTYLTDVTSVPAGSALMSLGLSRTTLGAFALPLPLSGFGLTNCWLNNDLVVTQACSMIGPTTARHSFPIPTGYQLLGFQVFLQTWAVAPLANPASLVNSNGLELTLGNF